MNKVIILIVIATSLLSGCKNDVHKHGDAKHEHLHGDEAHRNIGLEPLSYTLYTANVELFLEFKPLVAGKTSKFTAHITKLGKSFKALTKGFMIVKLIGNGTQLIDTNGTPSSPGIFPLALTPKTPGTYKLVFVIQTKEFFDKLKIPGITVYPDTKTALKNKQEGSVNEEIIYLKDQAWKIDFANMEIKREPFTEIIKTTGQILPAPGDEVTITARSNGIVTFMSNKAIIGSFVNPDETLFIISGGGLTEGNLDTKYKEAKNNYEKSKIDFDRAKELVKDNVISQKNFQETRLRYKNALSTFDTIEKNYTNGGHKITSSIQGYINNVMVSKGKYVEIGQPIATISQNLRLILKAEVPQKYFSRLKEISSANFTTAYGSKIYTTERLNGKLISYGKSANENAYYIPVNFEIDNNEDIIPGSFVEIFLKINAIKDALIIPFSTLIEEQGDYFAYVQTSGERFQKRKLEIGTNDGMNVQVLSGIKEGERVVIKGTTQIKLSTMSGKMPAHGHEH